MEIHRPSLSAISAFPVVFPYGVAVRPSAPLPHSGKAVYLPRVIPLFSNLLVCTVVRRSVEDEFKRKRPLDERNNLTIEHGC